MRGVIEVEHLRKFYDAVEAVSDLSLGVAGGEISRLLGRNGADKTAAAECNWGLRRPDAGSIGLLGPIPRARQVGGALEGVAAVLASVFLFPRGRREAFEPIFRAVDQTGSDTGTVASFTGTLVGAHFGDDVLPASLAENLQDPDYLSKTALYFHSIATRQRLGNAAIDLTPFFGPLPMIVRELVGCVLISRRSRRPRA